MYDQSGGSTSSSKVRSDILHWLSVAVMLLYFLSADRSEYPLRFSDISTAAKFTTDCRASSGLKCRSFLAPFGSLIASLSLGSLSAGSGGRVGG